MLHLPNIEQRPSSSFTLSSRDGLFPGMLVTLVFVEVHSNISSVGIAFPVKIMSGMCCCKSTINVLCVMRRFVCRGVESFTQGIGLNGKDNEAFVSSVHTYFQILLLIASCRKFQ